MTFDHHQKVTPSHLRREAFLYIRQSSLKQVLENTESTKRQYALRQQAMALGWPAERITVIDSDQARSGATCRGRDGFQLLVAEVGMGHAGIVMGLEVSRLARNNADWHRLLEICGFTDTLILDQDGLYDASQFNDRLLLGLKGAMSEAELHVLKSRLQGGILNKAARGELKVALPAGLVYDPLNRVVLEPDKQVQEAFGLFFATFARTGSASGVVKEFRRENIRFPRRCMSGPQKGEAFWGDLTHSQALRVLHQPRYAGAFCYGRRRTRTGPDGRSRYHLLPREEWKVLIKDAHPGYITWTDYEANQQRLADNSRAYGHDRRRSPPREGPALLQGLAICGRCGRRMTVCYHTRAGGLSVPDYVCQHEGIEHGHNPCQKIPGGSIDQAVGRLLVETVGPLSLDVALSVQKEVQSRIAEADRLREQNVERAQYEADLTQRRYLRVDPDNRLVADVLEAQWNEKLRELTQAREDCERQRQRDRLVLSEQSRQEILALATDFPKLWLGPRTSDRDRKRMVRLIIEDVTLMKAHDITLNIRFKGGAGQTLNLPLPLSAPQLRKTDSKVVEEIDQLLDEHTEAEIAKILNARGRRSGDGLVFTRLLVKKVRKTYGMKGRYERLQDRGLLSATEVGNLIGIPPMRANYWRKQGLLEAERANDKNDYLYVLPHPKAVSEIRTRLVSGRGSAKKRPSCSPSKR